MGNIIALDPATKFGVSSFTADGKHRESASISLKKYPLRWGGFHDELSSFLKKYNENGEVVDLLVIEEPIIFRARSPNFISPQLCGIAFAIAETMKIPYITANNKTVKKWATGSGNAGKPEIMEEARRRAPGVDVKDDNQADAILLALWAIFCVEFEKN